MRRRTEISLDLTDANRIVVSPLTSEKFLLIAQTGDRQEVTIYLLTAQAQRIASQFAIFLRPPLVIVQQAADE